MNNREPRVSETSPVTGCETCAECASFEFQPENIAPIYNNRTHFLTSQWNIPSPWYVAYRVTVAILITSWIIADFLDEAGQFYKDNYAIWLIFATNWSFLLLGVCAVFHAVLVVKAFVQSRRGCDIDATAEENRGLDVPIMIFWILYNCATNGAMVVTMSYWTFLISVDKAGFLINTMSRLKHTLNTVYVIVDLMISATPIRIFHVIYPLFWGAIYTIFNVVYFTNNGLGPNGQPYAYYIMDWRNPLESALTCSIGFILSTVLQCVLYGLYRLRLFIYGNVMHVRYDAIALEHGELLRDELPMAQEGEAENILGTNRTRASSYSSTENAEPRSNSSDTREVLVSIDTDDVTPGCENQSTETVH